MILIIPAIDIKNGRCVRLIQGEPGSEKIYSDDPVKTAKLWRRENAKILHVVDLDGALEGRPKNMKIIEKIVNAVDIPIEAGGGFRTYDDVKYAIEIGVMRVIISTIAIKNPELVKKLISDFSPRRIVMALDAKNGIVHIEGWKESTDISAVELALEMKKLGVERIVYTDILRDGTMRGPNLEAIKELAIKTGLKITASGGISGYEDLKRLNELEKFGVDSVIIGKALYENRFPCQKIWRIIEAKMGF
jgi:phosphoribosylformimino-5-aminoimidazole carboxamide ribotide isomerase